MESALQVRLRSPQRPLIEPRSSLLAVVAESANDAPPRDSVLPLVRSAAYVIARSAAEPPALYCEKSLFDAFKPLNASLSVVRARRTRHVPVTPRHQRRPARARAAQVCAALPALATEATRAGVLPASNFGGDEPSAGPAPDPEPMDWLLVAQQSVLNFARDTGGSTLQRGAEKLAKPRLRPALYREMIKSVPRMARHAYLSSSPKCSSFGACAAAAAVVGGSPIFYSIRAASSLAADVGLDLLRTLFPANWNLALTRSAFGKNARLKLLKHSATGLGCLLLGMCVPFVLAHPITFIVSDFAASLGIDLAFNAYLGVPA